MRRLKGEHSWYDRRARYPGPAIRIATLSTGTRSRTCTRISDHGDGLQVWQDFSGCGSFVSADDGIRKVNTRKCWAGEFTKSAEPLLCDLAPRASRAFWVEPSFW